jgi:hypothetical protein
MNLDFLSENLEFLVPGFDFLVLGLVFLAPDLEIRQGDSPSALGRLQAGVAQPKPNRGPYLIPALQKAARDHLRLDLRRAFENIEDAGVA